MASAASGFMRMTRDDLARRFVGVGVELGVAAGDFSATILGNPEVSLLWSIDRWADHHDEREYERACIRLGDFGDRSKILRSSFAAAAQQFADGSLDFVFIDGYAHTGQEDGKTLRDWWPKVRSGGIFAGHDYDQEYQRTVDEVDCFAAARNLYIHVTDEPRLPSWWVIK